MKKLFLILAISFLFASCEKETIEPNNQVPQEQVKCYTCYHTSVLDMSPAPPSYFYWETQWCGTESELEVYEAKQYDDHAGVDYCDCVEN